MGRAADVGARYDDLIGVAGDPLKDVSVLQTVAVVIKGGELVTTRR